DIIALNVPERRLEVRLNDAELAERRARWQPPKPRYERGWGWMFANHIEQADKGCDFDFLRTDFGGPVSEPEIN
ncbi:MAG: dihydroxy-acid dehydratase, partial [Pseudomonadota bacterium]